jgi:hypothetical protein
MNATFAEVRMDRNPTPKTLATMTRDQRMRLIMAPAGALGVRRIGSAAMTWAGVLMQRPSTSMNGGRVTKYSSDNDHFDSNYAQEREDND